MSEDGVGDGGGTIEDSSEVIGPSLQNLRLLSEKVMVFEGSVDADEDNGELASPERLAETHQVIVNAMRQTGQSSHGVVSDGKCDSRVPSLCLGVTASEEDVAGTHILQMALFRETGLIECSDVHHVVCQFAID
nr:unnamed protein product [Spirometra erinaceieuropaei]